MKALDALRERLARGAAPFDLRFAKNAWDDAALEADVPAVGREGSERLAGLVTSTARDGRTRAALVLGETGAGKTHVLSRLRRASSGKALFVAASAPRADALLSSLVEAARDDLRRLHVASDEVSRPQLAALVDPLVARFAPEALGADIDVVAPVLTPAELDERPALGARVLVSRIAPSIAARVVECPLELVRALLAERTGATGALAAALDALEPGRALGALGALGARAGVPLVFTLDQNDAVPGAEIARAVTRLHSMSGLVVVVTYLQSLWEARRDSLLEPERQRIEESVVCLGAPTQPEVLAFAQARLESLHRDLGVAAPDNLFPLTAPEIATAAPAGRPLLRDWCRALDSLLRARVGLKPTPTNLATTDRALEAGRQVLERLRAEIEARLPEGEPALREALALALRAGGFGDVAGPLDEGEVFDVRLTTAQERIGYAVVDAERPQSFARKLEQILDEIDAGTVARAFVLRTCELPASWKKSRELADELHDRGGEVVVLTSGERATLHALARLDKGSASSTARGEPLLARLVARRAAVPA